MTEAETRIVGVLRELLAVVIAMDGDYCPTERYKKAVSDAKTEVKRWPPKRRASHGKGAVR